MVVVPRWAGGGWSTRLGKKRFEGGSKEVLEYYRSVHRSGSRVKREEKQDSNSGEKVIVAFSENFLRFESSSIVDGPVDGLVC